MRLTNGFNNNPFKKEFNLTSWYAAGYANGQNDKVAFDNAE